MLLFDHNFSLDFRVGRENVSSGFSKGKYRSGSKLRRQKVKRTQRNKDEVPTENIEPIVKFVSEPDVQNANIKPRIIPDSCFAFGCWDLTEVD